MLFGLSNMFVRLELYVPLVYLPNMAVLSGVAVKEANFLISIFGKQHILYLDTQSKIHGLLVPFQEYPTPLAEYYLDGLVTLHG